MKIGDRVKILVDTIFVRNRITDNLVNANGEFATIYSIGPNSVSVMFINDDYNSYYNGTAFISDECFYRNEIVVQNIKDSKLARKLYPNYIKDGIYLVPKELK